MQGMPESITCSGGYMVNERGRKAPQLYNLFTEFFFEVDGADRLDSSAERARLVLGIKFL